MKLPLLIALLSLPMQAQLFSYGLKVGTPLTDSTVNVGQLSIPNSTTPLVIGPTAEIRIPVIGLGVEVDALYRRYKLQGTVNQWEFPILAKYRFPGIVLHPFVDAGPSFNHISDPGVLGQVLHGSSPGLTLGGGLEVKALIVRIAPELRYTFWKDQNLNLSTIQSGLGSSRNQLEFLVGITF